MNHYSWLGALLLAAPLTANGAQWPHCGEVDVYPGESWQQASVAETDWDKAKLADARKLFESLDSAAVMVVHRGQLIADWGTTEQKYTAQSIRKSLINSLFGIAIAEGDLQLDATLEDLGIDDTKPALTASERQATVQDLLLSRSGIYHSALYEVGGWKRVRKALATAKSKSTDETYSPGAYWFYNNWDFNALGTILEQASNEEIGSLFEDRIARQIGMQDFLPGDVEYSSKESRTEVYLENWSEHRAYVFDISTRDLARFGLLYLNCGAWESQQLVPRSWVLESIDGVDTSKGRLPQYRKTGFGDYGYLWQVEKQGSRRFEYLDTQHPYYMGSGNRGHLLVVMPYLDLVIAHQVATVGGIGFEAQKKRATEGSPAVDHDSLQRLIASILRAHPQHVGAKAQANHSM